MDCKRADFNGYENYGILYTSQEGYEKLKLILSSGDIKEPAVFYGEQIIWNPKPEKG